MATVDFKTQQKIKALVEGLNCDHVLVHLDSRVAGVTVPEYLQNQPAVVLKLSLLFSGATEYNDNQITANLKFGTEYYECIIPWGAVWGITSCTGKQRIWHDDMPKDVASGIFHAAYASAKNKTHKLKTVISKVFERKPSDATDAAEAESHHESPKTDKDAPSPNDRRKMLKLLK